jgi:hypothetical protein
MSTGRLLICLELGTCAVDEAEMIAASTDAAVEIATRARRDVNKVSLAPV